VAIDKPECHHRHQREDDPHVGSRGDTRRVVRKALIDRHAQHAQHRNLAQNRLHLCAVAQDRAQQERGEQQARQQPAIETDLCRKDSSGSGFGDDVIARPEHDGEEGIEVLHRSTVGEVNGHYRRGDTRVYRKGRFL
jgi:hypothetical protein